MPFVLIMVMSAVSLSAQDDTLETAQTKPYDADPFMDEHARKRVADFLNTDESVATAAIERMRYVRSPHRRDRH
ncbi:MAG: hypothetical protein AB8G99_05385, partial [Planctomycetaceae bacterium]